MPNDQLKSNFVDVFDAASTSLAIIEQQPDDQFYLVNSNPAFNRLPVDPGTDRPCLISMVFDRVQTTLLDAVMAKALQSGFPEEVELALDCEEDLQWWRMVASPFSDVAHGNARILLSCYDITVKKRLDLNRERVLSRMEQIVDSAYDGMLIFDRDVRVEYSNSAVERMFGYSSDEMLLMPLEDLIPARFRDRHHEYVKSFVESSHRAKLMEERAPVTALRKDGSEIPVEISISKFEMDGLLMMTAIVRDTTQRAEMMKELRRAAYEDPLTGIYNRRHMSRIMHRELQRVQRFDRYFSVMMIDLDHFKKINDTYGHAIGDELLMAFVAKVKQVTRSVDVFGRWGGEEFILLLPETKAEDAEVAAENIRRNLRGDEKSNDELYGLTASYGIAQVNQQEQTIESILERVDAALYQAKSDGRDCIRRR